MELSIISIIFPETLSSTFILSYSNNFIIKEITSGIKLYIYLFLSIFKRLDFSSFILFALIDEFLILRAEYDFSLLNLFPLFVLGLFSLDSF